MDLRTYKASSLTEALRLVREDLGPDASVLHTRQVSGGLLSWLGAASQIEVTASAEVQVPSRFELAEPPFQPENDRFQLPAAELQDFRQKFRDDLTRDRGQRLPQSDRGHAGTTLALLKRELLAAGVREDLAQSYLQRLRSQNSSASLSQMQEMLLGLVAADIATRGPLRVLSGQRNLVAFVGPTGVGKTTTIAKLAANYRLQQGCRVGLVTVDTFRIAAVEQLRTYAEIMDLPMEVVSTPAETAAAIDRLSDVDLILMDTAGCSPRDDAHMAQLQATLAAAVPDEVLLVLSGTAAVESSLAAMERFGHVGATSVVLTKVDEGERLGGLLPLLQQRHLPVRYVTDGQNVPHDIRPAQPRQLAEMFLTSTTGALSTTADRSWEATR